jgi:hypothetical protein
MNLFRFTLLLCIVLMASCATKHSSRASYGYTSSANGAFEMEDRLEADNSFGEDIAVGENRKILYSASLTLAVKEPDSIGNSIEGVAKKFGGYLSHSSATSITILVKSENIKVAVDELATLGKASDKSFYSQDVTAEYTNYAIRLENAEKARDRYLELLAKAENVTAAVAVEKELERLNETIDLIKGNMNLLDHREEFSSITISVHERKKPGLLGYIGIGLYESVKWLFVRN